jgi:hypothetical protein
MGVEIWARNVEKVENRKQKGMNSWKEEKNSIRLKNLHAAFFFIFSYISQST